ncbi:peroxide stress protein YaaA [Streptococcus pseudoporcinus]|uniref:UPF0246 protein NCTC5386_02094 n=1 Tax=Streptococcus pseudoporcinus TaxID=361101 RepID=A0A4U9YI98_9STRE|nr:peroxide stress protein YaaA [Streptococcus pseudoporcinus]VTS26016.1 hypothetical cytosolic protein [Streptococcus pseudoporcinus]VUC71583.1 hypothetical cytosolic protein [Streptococcus pseudoporcinus]VUD00904.1 hypothetical cytosolic protein [Streptococcus pseudoporcinus]VUD01205.1 hypothetical cytosolic protein [Streptococcus pseudoporcinus]
MLTFLIPTAKEMKIPKQSFPPNIPENSSAIIDQLASLSLKELAVAYKLKETATQKEFDRIQSIKKGQAPTYPAYQLFNGLMYRHFDREQLSQQEKNYLLTHTFITSSLYGIIPMDFPIAEHRLDFQTKLKIHGKSLKHYWRKDYDHFLKDKKIIISLLSTEFEEVFSKDKNNLWISLLFLEEKAGTLKSHSTISKKGRGDFLKACAQSNCQDIKDLKKLVFKGFSFSEEQSDRHKFVYIKKEA